jgi:hypothetical protein
MAASSEPVFTDTSDSSTELTIYLAQPCLTKIRSTGADDAGIVKYLQAIVDKIGILVLPVLKWVTVHGKTWLS